MKKISVIGAGSWGSTLALLLYENGHDVTLYTKGQKHYEELSQKHTNSRYLENITFPEGITYTYDLKKATQSAECVVLAVTSQATREVLKQMKPHLKPDAVVVNVSKGLELGTNLLLSQVYEEVIGNENFVVLSGPSHAEEVSVKIPTAVVCASKKEEISKDVQKIFSNNYFRVYTNSDVIGVEVGGALKNIIALGSGISDAIGYGANTRAAIITRGISEISRFGKKLGANPLTFLGLTGVGDLIVTCNSKLSRNKRAGALIAKGYNAKQITEQIHMVVEGIPTTKAVYEFAKVNNISMPLTDAIYDVIYESHDIKDTVKRLMNRNMKEENLTEDMFINS